MIFNSKRRNYIGDWAKGPKLFRAENPKLFWAEGPELFWAESPKLFWARNYFGPKAHEVNYFEVWAEGPNYFQ